MKPRIRDIKTKLVDFGNEISINFLLDGDIRDIVVIEAYESLSSLITKLQEMEARYESR